MTRLASFVMFVTLLSATAATAGLPCSIHPKKGAPAMSLPALAKLPLAEAQRTALANIEAPPDATVAERELEVEHGCLVYSFDIKIPGKSGIEEVMVDPGTGNVLSRKHESARQEAVEQAKDKASEGKPQ
jgi:Peptidase propeptide and YPEB domain